ncbi:hypothetical protein PIB30_031020, partial [Stylosanthes scabra]|nr:hypothetical protein [Stylosanthes scabra]
VHNLEDKQSNAAYHGRRSSPLRRYESWSSLKNYGRRRNDGNVVVVKAVEREENRRGGREHGDGWTRFSDGKLENVVDREQLRSSEDERRWLVVDEIDWNLEERLGFCLYVAYSNHHRDFVFSHLVSHFGENGVATVMGGRDDGISEDF